VTILAALVRLWHHAQLRMAFPPDGGWYGASFLERAKRNRSPEEFLADDSRKLLYRLIRATTCVFCGAPVLEGEGDHLIPVAQGGSPGWENFAPLSRVHNGSGEKGARDLLEWIATAPHLPKTKTFGDVPMLYARLQFRRHRERGTLWAAAPYFVHDALRTLAMEMPAELGTYIGRQEPDAAAWWRGLRPARARGEKRGGGGDGRRAAHYLGRADDADSAPNDLSGV
jgi:hypothetical protein